MNSTNNLSGTQTSNGTNNPITNDDINSLISMLPINLDENSIIFFFAALFIFIFFLLIYYCSINGLLKPFCKKCLVCEFEGDDTLELLRFDGLDDHEENSTDNENNYAETNIDDIMVPAVCENLRENEFEA
ncbi:hypothetical protein PGAL8A_00410400 [Plasmodium gallinaceum]|uniref:Uncharacterized protein n=1 Tax=Plasmodium gallinaceum TaxID=5849 RepID=A0A1J1GPP6_PLAGA|nr:hypothetical protein PGAL8A_00410400 [Plasmodium gallinaceum]CRG94397.1 hypothetical protein PGAL8A_00410400 [Plasmodium gallinaceum]